MPCRLHVARLCALLAVVFLAAGRGYYDLESPSASVIQADKTLAVTPVIISDDTTMVSGLESDSFSDAMRAIVSAADSGSGFRFRAPGVADQEILLRPQKLFAPGFRMSIGVEGEDGFAGDTPGMRVYEGRSFFAGNGRPPATVSLAIVGSAMHMEIVAADGSQLTVAGSDPQNVSVQLSLGSPIAGAKCEISDSDGRAVLKYSDLEHVTDHDGESSDGMAQSLIGGSFESGSSVLGLSGADPATGKLDRFVEPIPMGEQYALSLKDMLLLLVLDKEATGANTRENLASKASQTIARIANVATIYENQLGIRLLLQELIMIPNADAYADVPFVDPLGDFRDWCHEYRRFSRYNWTCAMKEGAGLRAAGTLGLANVGQILRRNAVAVVQSNSDYLVFAHELAHNLGTVHTNGGIMNARATADHRRSFFDDVLREDGETAAKKIYSFVGSRLGGAAAMRHPEQMPFAMSDFAETKAGEAISLQVLLNDADHVRHGAKNTTLSVVETSKVLPDGAGSASVLADGRGVGFRPAADFTGTAWFSYTLRGNVGNESQGWLHKGDVAVAVVGDGLTDDQALQIRLRPGASYSFYPQQAPRSFTQPQQAQMLRSEDDRNLLILRVPDAASGTDTFRVGDDIYTITYLNEPPVAIADRAWIDRYRSEIWIQPLVNDIGSGQHWLQQIDPILGVGTDRPNAGTSHFFSTSMLLVNAENLDEELGAVSLEKLPATINGQSRKLNTGRLLFVPRENVQGTATIIYTLEDASGRRVEGQINVDIDTGYDTLVLPDALAKVMVPGATAADGLLGWIEPSFDDVDWRSGPLGVGYETSGGYENWIGTDVRDALFQSGTGVYVRVPFVVSDTSNYTSLGFRARFDDGFVAYLNGRKVVSKNAPVAPVWSSSATASDEHNADEPFYVVDLSGRRELLQPGENVLAVHVMNDAASSSDLLMQPVLVAYPSAPGPAVASPLFGRFREWRGSFDFSDGDPGGDWLVWDSDFDGFTDLVEFVAHGSPVDAGSVPRLSVQVARSGVRGTVVLRYFQRSDAAELGIIYSVEQTVSSTIEQWEEIDPDVLRNQGGSVTVTPAGDGFETVNFRIPFDSRGLVERFYRVRYGLPN